MRQWRWLWSCCPGIGPVRLRALEAEAQAKGMGLDDCWRLPRDQLREMLGWSSSLLDRIEGYRARCGVNPDLRVPTDLVMVGDDTWPSLLDRIDRPPLGLFLRGKRSLLSCLQKRQAVAVIGTRAASAHGQRMAFHLSQQLAVEGWPVLSGLAEGIDAAAHRGCLEAGGSPVAILGTALNRVYPRHHESLQAAVGHSGLLISEHPPGTSIQRGHFASRNRLLVALACAVVVIECPEQSGALITARIAASDGCPVWVVPGDALRWSVKGSNALLGDGATPLTSSDVLIQDLGPGPLATGQTQPLGVTESRPSLSCSQRDLLKLLDQGASIEALSLLQGCSVGCVVRDLLHLEVNGLAVCYEGNSWHSVQH